MSNEQDTYELKEFASLNGEDNKLSFLEKAFYVTTGPLLGMLPPPIQRRIASEEAAALMSKTSRYVNALWGVYGLVSAGCKAFGVDIDPTPGSVATWGGVASAVSSVIREGTNLVAYEYCHPYVEHLKVWGEPIISCAYSSLVNKKKL